MAMYELHTSSVITAVPGERSAKAQVHLQHAKGACSATYVGSCRHRQAACQAPLVLWSCSRGCWAGAASKLRCWRAPLLV